MNNDRPYEYCTFENTPCLPGTQKQFSHGMMLNHMTKHINSTCIYMFI